MRASTLGVVLFVAVLFPTVGKAQVYQFRTPPPEVTAATAAWQVSGEPILVQGIRNYPTREYRMFDGQVMAQIGVYQGVPVYADTTLEPYSVVYVPVGTQRVRAYERLRDRELAGTTGSRVPAFPVVSPSAPVPVERIVGTAGPTDMIVPTAVGTSGIAAVAPDRARPTRTRIEMIPHPSPGASEGVWVQFNGARWYAAGAAVPFTPDRFVPVGAYRGFPVYRDSSSGDERIWVSVVADGPLAPYVRK